MMNLHYERDINRYAYQYEVAVLFSTQQYLQQNDRRGGSTGG